MLPGGEVRIHGDGVGIEGPDYEAMRERIEEAQWRAQERIEEAQRRAQDRYERARERIDEEAEREGF